MPVNRPLQVYQRIWSILLADNIGPESWAEQVPEGNRIRFDGDEKDAQKKKRGAGDFYEFELQLGGFTDDLDGVGATFCGPDEIVTQEYLGYITSKSTNITRMTLIAARAVSLLRAAQRVDRDKMGLAFTAYFTRIIARRPRMVELPDAPGVKRLQLEMVINVNMQFGLGTAPA